MNEMRIARNGEIARQKEIWKICFGDDDDYIDFYYSNRYKTDETALLLQDGEIAAMLTMIPIRLVLPDFSNINAAMLYAVATHPKYQMRGLASQLIAFSNQHLKSRGIDFSVLVPAEKKLFDFYNKQGFAEGFYIREAVLGISSMKSIDIDYNGSSRSFAISPADAGDYNRLRNELCRGRLYIGYEDEDIEYQKKLSQNTGADIFILDCGGSMGCATVERINSNKVLLKELLVPDELIGAALRKIADNIDAEEYIVRTPAFTGQNLGGHVKPFGMIQKHRELNIDITQNDLGYLAFAFD